MFKKMNIADKDHLQRIKTIRGKIRFLCRVQARDKFKLDEKYYKLRKERKKIIDGKCKICGEQAYCYHHIRPLSRGGKNKKANFIPICLECHRQVHHFMK